jgi:hypothetical protein
MQVVFTGTQFECRLKFDERNIPKEAGFFWDNTNKVWYTKKYGVAARLHAYLDDTARNELAKKRIMIETWTGGLSVPKGQKLYDFQENACLFSLARNKSYLGLDPGLGKTPCAAVIAQSLNDFQQCVAGVYICPPFLTRNTEVEFNRWSRLRTIRYNHKKPGGFGTEIIIFPDSLIARKEVINDIRTFMRIAKSEGRLLVLFVDEAHRFKNHTAKRTVALFNEVANGFDRVTYLSGTPMPNRPIELYPVLSHSAQQCIHGMGVHEYALKYCGAFEHEHGWDYNGATNLDELRAQVIGTFMQRVRKADVLKELPPKTEEMVILEESLPPKLTKLSKDILATLSPDDLMRGQVAMKLQTNEEVHLSTYRKELGIIKAKPAAAFIKYILEETDESILVFAIHKEVIKTLDEELSHYSPLVITGETRMELRHAMVNEFQQDRKRRVFIGNIQAAGTGLTLTKASRVVFVEFSWVPADNDQASDRAHRIGQTDNVLVQYLVYESSVDKTVIETVLKKKKITEKI